MLQQLKQFKPEVSGNMGIIFSICLVPLLLAAGSAIDYLRYNNTRTAIRAALDGAAMAAALPADATNKERIDIARSYFDKNLTEHSISLPKLNVTIDDDTVTASVDTAMPTSFMLLAGINDMRINEFSEVMRPFAGQAEVVLVLDYSLSMKDDDKYLRMGAAASEMIKELYDAIPAGKLKLGLVPFSGMVFTSMNASYVTQVSAGSTWTGCTQDRTYPFNTTVSTPTSDPESKWGYYDKNKQNSGSYDCSAYQSKGLKIIPLTTDIGALQTKLSAMKPLGYTNITLGAEFGFNLLDPDLPYDEGLPYSNRKNRKYLILLTDGVQTTNQWGPLDSRTVANAGPNLLSICQSMRDLKITIFTIAYDVTDPAVTSLLQQCSSGKYYEPSADGSEISKVFSLITRQIQNRTARLSR